MKRESGYATKRESISIRSQELENFIIENAKKLGKSKSAFIEYILMSTMRSKGIKKKFIDEKHDYSKGMTETIALIKKVDECKETSPITHYTCRESLSEKITITISNKSLFKRHDNKFEINKPVLVNEVKRAIIHFF